MNDNLQERISIVIKNRKQLKKTQYTSTTPLEWSDLEIEVLTELKQKGISNKDIASILKRTETSVSIKSKRLGKSQNTYNENHVEEKYYINNEFLELIKPKTVLDCYCGKKNFYKEFQVTTNDLDKEIDADFHLDALEFICKQYPNKFDLVDLDPYGSAYDLFDLAIKMAKKGIVITYGELGHKRWKRTEFVKNRYNIENIEEFTLDKLIKETKKIGIRNKKELVVFKSKNWGNIGRVWYQIKPYKETQQWTKKEFQQLTIMDVED